MESNSLDKLFNPKSIVIVGVSSREFHFGGASFLQRLQEAGYPGRLYPVNPKAESIRGLKCYPNLKSLPETPDLAMVSIPAQFVPALLEECGQLGIRHIHILTSGFKEMDTPEGLELEKQLQEVSSRHRLMVVGPNCMGPYSPSSRLTAWGAIPGIDGPVGVISQSGGITQRFTELMCSQGVGISKAVSMGNSTVLDACDYLAYMGADNTIRVIAIYLEDVRDNRRLLDIAREINLRKPVVLLRGGDSEAGSRTIASHTGAMGGSRNIWEAFFRQTGVIKVRSMEEWADTVMTMCLLPDMNVGKGVFLASGGGGYSTVNSDIFNHAGLSVPELSSESMGLFRDKVPVFGSISGNPLDSFGIFSNPQHVKDITGIVVDDPAISMIVVDRLIPRQAFHIPDPPNQAQETIDCLQPICRQKPTVVTVDSDGGDLELVEKGAVMRKTFCEQGIAAFSSPVRAAQALANYYRYQSFKYGPKNPEVA